MTTTTCAGKISYEPAGKFKFGNLMENKVPYEDRKIESLLERVEKKIGHRISSILDTRREPSLRAIFEIKESRT